MEVSKLEPGCVEDAPIAKKKLEVECPFCGAILVIDINGRLVESRRKNCAKKLDWHEAMIPDEGW